MRYAVLQTGGDFHCIDRQTGDLGVIPEEPPGRLAQYADVIDPDDAHAAWVWEQVLNAFPDDAANMLQCLSNCD